MEENGVSLAAIDQGTAVTDPLFFNRLAKPPEPGAVVATSR